MADGLNTPPVEEDGRTYARHDGADPKRGRPFSAYNTLRSMFALIRKVGMLERVGREGFVDRHAVDGCG